MNLQLPKGYKRAVLVFDGAMSQPVVSVNGKEAGKWAYGYNAFRIDITPYVQFGGKKNLVEVHLNNVEESSRWYPGGGLYRPVSVELYGNENFSTWDTFVRTLKADKQEAEVEVNALLEGKIGKSGKTADYLWCNSSHQDYPEGSKSSALVSGISLSLSGEVNPI